MRNVFFVIIMCLFCIVISRQGFAQQGAPVTVSEILGEKKECNFDWDKDGDFPRGFKSALTGKGNPGRWFVMKIEHAPTNDNVVVQVKHDKTDYRFPLLILDDVDYKDATAWVWFRAIDGQVDQSGGLVFRYKDENNYYVLRANALENNVRLYKVVNGKRIQIGSKNTPVTANEWHLLKVLYDGNRLACFYENTKIMEIMDDTFDSGSIGLWTKSDSYTYFDTLVVQEAYKVSEK
ncbi:MAG: hypothetical protein MRJ65_15105 [Candidatus Brocadiaceae bacterium]|nr:hypothetical protein [Candidatus Brocadiaceae bacterium]